MTTWRCGTLCLVRSYVASMAMQTRSFCRTISTSQTPSTWEIWSLTVVRNLFKVEKSLRSSSSQVRGDDEGHQGQWLTLSGLSGPWPYWGNCIVMDHIERDNPHWTPSNKPVPLATTSPVAQLSLNDPIRPTQLNPILPNPCLTLNLSSSCHHQNSLKKQPRSSKHFKPHMEWRVNKHGKSTKDSGVC